MSDKLPDVSHLRGLGNPMFFSFNVEPKSNILICHAAIMGTFILPPDRTLSLCEEKDDPRLPHFIDYIIRNKITATAAALYEIEKAVGKGKRRVSELDKLIEQSKQKHE